MLPSVIAIQGMELCHWVLPFREVLSLVSNSQQVLLLEITFKAVSSAEITIHEVLRLQFTFYTFILFVLISLHDYHSG